MTQHKRSPRSPVQPPSRRRPLPQHGVVLDERGQEQPADKRRAQQAERAQADAARQPPNSGQPAKGE